MKTQSPVFKSSPSSAIGPASSPLIHHPACVYFALSDALCAGSSNPPHPSIAWRDYFRTNAEHLLEIPWEQGVDFTDAEWEAVAGSIPEFQLGESSEGRHLMTRGIRHAVDTGDATYIQALRLFMVEEHRHARDLGRVLDLAGIPRVGRTWPDTVFRWLRKGAGLELSLAVLVTAELIASVYVAALREATESVVLRRLCDQIMLDELQHVRFQCERLAFLRRGRWRLSIRLRRGVHRLFLAGTALVVWSRHHRVLKAGGYRFRRFCRQTFAEMHEAMIRMDPASYCWQPVQLRSNVSAGSRTPIAATS